MLNQDLTLLGRSVGLTTLAATLSWALLVEALGRNFLVESPLVTARWVSIAGEETSLISNYCANSGVYVKDSKISWITRTMLLKLMLIFMCYLLRTARPTQRCEIVTFNRFFKRFIAQSSLPEHSHQLPSFSAKLIAFYKFFSQA